MRHIKNSYLLLKRKKYEFNMNLNKSSSIYFKTGNQYTYLDLFRPETVKNYFP